MRAPLFLLIILIASLPKFSVTVCAYTFAYDGELAESSATILPQFVKGNEQRDWKPLKHKRLED